MKTNEELEAEIVELKARREKVRKVKLSCLNSRMTGAYNTQRRLEGQLDEDIETLGWIIERRKERERVGNRII